MEPSLSPITGIKYWYKKWALFLSFFQKGKKALFAKLCLFCYLIYFQIVWRIIVEKNREIENTAVLLQESDADKWVWKLLFIMFHHISYFIFNRAETMFFLPLLPTQEPKGLVTFTRQAISSPPNWERYAHFFLLLSEPNVISQAVSPCCYSCSNLLRQSLHTANRDMWATIHSAGLLWANVSRTVPLLLITAGLTISQLKGKKTNVMLFF